MNLSLYSKGLLLKGLEDFKFLQLPFPLSTLLEFKS